MEDYNAIDLFSIIPSLYIIYKDNGKHKYKLSPFDDDENGFKPLLLHDKDNKYVFQWCNVRGKGFIKQFIGRTANEVIDKAINWCKKNNLLCLEL